MNNTRNRILLAEDDPHLGALLTEYLGAEGFDVKLCKDGELAVKAFSDEAYDLCLLDVMMPKMDGFSVANHIREKDSALPIIFITARSLREDKLKGYGLGADDYITKPFDAEELLWKIRAIMRRNIRGNDMPSIVTIGKYSFDHANQSLSINGKIKRITEKESEILNYLSENRNRVIRREEMLQALWGENDYFLGRSLDVFITKIRKYLKEDPGINIENIFKVGFIFNVPAG